MNWLQEQKESTGSTFEKTRARLGLEMCLGSGAHTVMVGLVAGFLSHWCLPLLWLHFLMGSPLLLVG